MTNDDTTKAAALYLLKRGLASYVEIAEMFGRSRQIVAHWGKDYPNARAEYLARIKAKALLSADKNRQCG